MTTVLAFTSSSYAEIVGSCALLPVAHQSPMREIVDGKSVNRHEVAGSQYEPTRYDALTDVKRTERHGKVVRTNVEGQNLGDDRER